MIQLSRTVSAATRLGGLSLLGLGLVSLIHWGVEARITANQKATLLHHIEAVLPHGSFDNDPLSEALTVNTKADPVQQAIKVIYPARRGGQPVALILRVVAPDGYNGAIELLVALAPDGTVLRVRTVAHRETPGLGDGIEAEKSEWIERFRGLALGNPPESRWAVKRDGGHFDQFTGATITPRAVVKAVRKALVWFKENRDSLGYPPGKTD